MRLRGLAEGTQQVYVEAVKHLAVHYSRSPDQLTEDEVRDFILHLTDTRKLAKSTVRVHLFALKFLYRMTLQRNWPVLSLARVKKPNRLPVILSREEARHLLALIRRPAARMSCVMMYSCGLRSIGSHTSQTRRHRQWTHGRVRATRQRRQGSNRTAAAADTRASACLLGRTSSGQWLALPGTGQPQSDRHQGRGHLLEGRPARERHQEAGHLPIRFVIRTPRICSKRARASVRFRPSSAIGPSRAPWSMCI